MYNSKHIAVIIPVLNEEKSIGKVISAIPGFVDQVIVCDNGSSDNTPTIASEAGATVVFEQKKGYGAACLRGIQAVDSITDIIVFLDGDYSDYPEEMIYLVDPIVFKNCEMVIGSRMLKKNSKVVLTPVARFGNWLSTYLIKIIWKNSFTDLGPFRAITTSALSAMKMKDKNYGWTIEMQIKASKMKLMTTEVAVSYRERIGQSKISGTILGSVKAGYKILYLIIRETISA